MNNRPECVVVLPTYNEAGNIAPLTEKILSQGEGITVLVVDDDSEDGTWEVVQRMAGENERVKLVRRKEDKGRGLAGREGFLRALEAGPDCVVEMDADFSHDPSHIPALIEATGEAGVVIGSRFVKGGGDGRRSRLRKLITFLARCVIRWVLGIKVSDPTSGFRCFTSAALRDIDPASLRSETPFIVLETLYRAFRKGIAIKEVPIIFRPRKGDRSKLNLLLLFRCLIDVIVLRMGGSERDGVRF